jgi:hypothetical protein
MPLAGIGVREHPEMLAEFFGIHGDGARGPGPVHAQSMFTRSPGRITRRRLEPRFGAEGRPTPGRRAPIVSSVDQAC